MRHLVVKIQDAPKSTLPDIAAKAVFEVITAVSTVARRLAFYGSDWITSTGRRDASHSQRLRHPCGP